MWGETRFALHPDTVLLGQFIIWLCIYHNQAMTEDQWVILEIVGTMQNVPMITHGAEAGTW